MIEGIWAVTNGGLTKQRVLGALCIGFMILVSLWLAIARPDFGSLAVYGYPGLFVLMAASSASVLFPLPGFATVMAAGTFGNLFLIAISAGLGSALGEMTGYMVGAGGRALIQEKNLGLCKRFEGWLRRYGFLALLVFASVPNPAFDLVGIAAGSLCYPVRKFLLACAIGNTLKYLFLASLGKTASILFMGS